MSRSVGVMSGDVGTMLRSWRSQRRLSQLELAGRAAVSTRHLSCVETGRARPSREMVMHLAEELDVPLRARNSLLLAAGYAPAFQHVDYQSDAFSSVRTVVEQLIAAHDPHPALVVDGRWNLLAINRAGGFFTDLVDAELIVTSPNAMLLTLHPDGFIRHAKDPGRLARDLTTRLRRQVEQTGDDGLKDLLATIEEFPCQVDAAAVANESTSDLVMPLDLIVDGIELAFVSTITTFGAPLDVLPSELAIETFHPLDDTTRQFLAHRLAN